MTHLHKISQFLYFHLTMIFIVFVYLFQRSGDVDITGPIPILFTILLIPVFEALLNLLGCNYKNFINLSQKQVISTIIYIIVLIVCVVMGYASLGILIILSLIYACIVGLDSRVFFVAAIIVFCYVALFLVLGNSLLSEQLSIGAYYMLIAGVVTQIYQNILSPKTLQDV